MENKHENQNALNLEEFIWDTNPIQKRKRGRPKKELLPQKFASLVEHRKANTNVNTNDHSHPFYFDWPGGMLDQWREFLWWYETPETYTIEFVRMCFSPDEAKELLEETKRTFRYILNNETRSAKNLVLDGVRIVNIWEELGYSGRRVYWADFRVIVEGLVPACFIAAHLAIKQRREPFVEVVGVATSVQKLREQLARLDYESLGYYHARRGLEPQTIWIEKKAAQHAEFLLFDLMRIFFLGFKNLEPLHINYGNINVVKGAVQLAEWHNNKIETRRRKIAVKNWRTMQTFGKNYSATKRAWLHPTRNNPFYYFY